jgi:Glycosyl transferase family 2
MTKGIKATSATPTLSPLSVNIIYNKANTYGLTDDVRVIERILRHLQDTVGPINKARTADLREPLIHSDINIHLEIPVYSAAAWAHTNIILVNPEQWSYAYDAYAHAFDALVFRDSITAAAFRQDFAKKGIPTDNIYVVPWTAAWQVKDIKKGPKGVKEGFICFIAASTSKYEYIKKLLPSWKTTDPALTIYTTRADFAEDLKKVNAPATNIKVNCEDLDEEARNKLMTLYRGHIVCSAGEAFGYAAANAEVAGAFSIMNSLPVFEEMYGRSNPAIGWISNTYEVSDKVRYSTASPGIQLREELDAAFAMFNTANFNELYTARQYMANKRFMTTCNEFLPVLTHLYSAIRERRPKKGNYICPPVISSDYPPITVITPTYNRVKLFEIAFHNLLLTDYPKNKIEWIVIEDNDMAAPNETAKPNNAMVGESVMSFQVQVPEIKIKYIPIQGRMTIGEKRNIGVENAANDIILFMDDDDHYPETSFRRRVSWLNKGTKRGSVGQANIACCTTLALYDLKRGISAVNVPPYDIPFAQRISEATLTFRKSAWVERKFSNVSFAEGEDWITGREDQVIEIPPQQIIVAFSHGSNQSARRIPPTDQKPACFWHFPQEYLVFIHGLVGVQVEVSKK